MGAGATGTDTGDIHMGALLARHTIPAPGWLKHRYKTDSERDNYHILLSFWLDFRADLSQGLPAFAETGTGTIPLKTMENDQHLTGLSLLHLGIA